MGTATQGFGSHPTSAAPMPGMVPGQQQYPVQPATQPPVIIHNYPGYRGYYPLNRTTWQYYGVACHGYCTIVCVMFAFFFLIAGTINLSMLNTIDHNSFSFAGDTRYPFIVLGPMFLILAGILIITAIVMGCKGKKKYNEAKERLRNDPNALSTGYPGAVYGGPVLPMNQAYPGVPPGQPAAYPGVIPGQPAPYPGMTPGQPAPYPGMTPGQAATYPGVTPIQPTAPSAYPGVPTAQADVPPPYPGVNPGQSDLNPNYPGANSGPIDTKPQF